MSAYAYNINLSPTSVSVFSDFQLQTCKANHQATKKRTSAYAEHNFLLLRFSFTQLPAKQQALHTRNLAANGYTLQYLLYSSIKILNLGILVATEVVGEEA